MSYQNRGDRRRHAFSRVLGFASLCIAALAPCAHAAQFDITLPAGGVQFGTSVTVLPNGNIVVTDPNGPTSDIGAVYLYSPTGVQISVLTGSNTDDFVGGDGIVVVGGGNFVVLSSNWNNGAATHAGAVTWVNGTTGLSDVVSMGNSLIGTTASDYVGSRGIRVLSNGNYVVRSPFWNNGAATGAGAVTWVNGNAGLSGAVSTTNSLVGTTANDNVGNFDVIALTNGNYVVASAYWNNGAVTQAGAATWADGSKAISGTVSAANSLVGMTANDFVGNSVTALSNGHYVVASPNWSNGTATSTGAVTWGDGTMGISGTITTNNSLTGSSPNDGVGFPGATALNNGNYVVASLNWNDVTASRAGAVTWLDGSATSSGHVSVTNSLIGTTANDTIGNGGIVALNNGSYVIKSPSWSNGTTAGAGAVTWGSGTSKLTGMISASNSLVGTAANDAIGNRVIALTNGNYVVGSDQWSNGAATTAGAVTWGDGTTGVSGPLSLLNSLVGVTTGDGIGSTVVALANGNYVATSSLWTSGGMMQAGAATWANGNAHSSGAVSTTNSLAGASAFDQVSSNGVTALSNGNYIVASPFWNDGTTTQAGAITWARGGSGLQGAISASNSLIGTQANEYVGSGRITATSDGNYIVASPGWNNGSTPGSGAVTLASGNFRLAGTIQPWNSVLGSAAHDGFEMNYAYDATRHRLVVGRPGDNTVSVFTMDQIFADGVEL